jgi:archaellum component FlaC
MEALEMERPMTEWNDDRLDELNGRIKEGFTGVDKRFTKVEERFTKVEERFTKVDERFTKVDERFGQVEERFGQVDKRFEPLATREDVAELRGEMNVGLNRISDRIDRLYNVVIVAGVGVIGTLLANGIWG